jgi:hypothetical protein
MRRFKELTTDELVALTDEQVRKLIEIEIAIAAIKPVEVPVEPSLSKEGITAGVIGYTVGDLVFTDEKDAQHVANMSALKSAYSYNISYNYRWLEPAGLKVERAAFYLQSDVLRIAGALKENEKKRTVYNKQKGEYNEYLRNTTDISETVWRAVSDAKTRHEQIESAKRHYLKFLDLADGDASIAEKFFRDAFKSDAEITKIVLELNNKQKGNQDGTAETEATGGSVPAWIGGVCVVEQTPAPAPQEQGPESQG